MYLATLPMNLLAMQSWFYGVLDGSNISVLQNYANVSWSISTEFCLYLLFIPLCLLGKFGSASRTRGVLLLLIGSLGHVIIVIWGQAGPSEWLETTFGSSPSLPAGSWLIFYSPLSRFWEFMTGMGLAELWLARRDGPNSLTASILITVAGIAALLYILASWMNGLVLQGQSWLQGNALHIGYSLAVPAALYFLCQGRSTLHSSLVAKPFLFIGEISYSIYLLHADLFPLFRMPAVADPSQQIPEILLRSLIFFALLLLLSWRSYVSLEVPLRRRIVAASELWLPKH
jgi:peptidoglycan/LPS O-acetylase OafA/YrhL